MLIVTEAARARIAQELGSQADQEPTALRLLFIEDGFDLVLDRIQDRDVRFDSSGRTVLVIESAIGESLSDKILHVDPSDHARLRLVSVNARRSGGRPQVTRQTRRDRPSASGNGTARSPDPLRHRRVTRHDGSALVERYRLTKPQMKVLNAVSSEGELSMRKLRQRSRLNRGSVQRITEGLQRRGLVKVLRQGKGPGGDILVRITNCAREMLEQSRSA